MHRSWILGLLCSLLICAAVSKSVSYRPEGYYDYRPLPERYGNDDSSECEYVFSIFGFLSFILALLDLVIIISSSTLVTIGRSLRIPRELMNHTKLANTCFSNYNPQNSTEFTEAAHASFVMLRTFLIAMSSNDGQCVGHLMCRGGREAALLGPVGRTIADLTRSSAALWLQRINESVYSGVDDAVEYGMEGKNCTSIYQSCPYGKLKTIPIYRGNGIISDKWNVKDYTSFQSMNEFIKKELSKFING